MNGTFFKICMALVLVTGLAIQAQAQPIQVREARVAELLEFAREARDKAQNERALAQLKARRVGLPVRRVFKDGRVLEIQRFADGDRPAYYITNNTLAADSISTDELWPGGATGLGLDGTDMVVGEWDGGATYADHPDLIGRVVQADGATEISNHSTHVAGTLIGAGAYLIPDAKGMAFAAELAAYDWNMDAAEMATAAANGLLLSNHSYGIAAGWLYIGDAAPDTWWWIGGADDLDIEDPNFGYYDSVSRDWDQIAVDAPYYLIVKAAGNDGSDVGPAPGEEYTVINQDGDPLFVSDIERNPDCTPLGFDCLPTHSVAKNILTVGAVDDLPGGYNPLTGSASVILAEFSSRGPTDDGRIKPDLVGNGVFLMSTWADFPLYAASAGTSMAAPSVTGSLLLLQELHQEVNGADQFLRAASLKALAIHTADEAGKNPGPDYWFGWGLMNSKKAAEVISNDSAMHQVIEGTLAEGQSSNVVFNVSDAGAILVATLVWADPPATPVAPSLDPTDPMLVNDLDLRIKQNATVHFPWVLDPANPADAATRADNVRDNVEQVLLTAVSAGDHVVTVSHKGNLLNHDSQDYSLVISQRPPALEAPVSLIEEGFEAGLPDGWMISSQGGVSWEVRSPVASDGRYDNLTGGAGDFAMVDNNYTNESYTGLESPILDLGEYYAAVLRFNSYYYYDTFETINVEVSTDGGFSWARAWTFQGFNPLPTPYIVDLSSWIAGEANARFRFWWDSEGELSGDLWQVDDVVLEVYGNGPPSQNELCSGESVDLQNHTFSGGVQCVASLSFLAHSNTTVPAGAQVEVIAPTVSLGAGFVVEIGGTLSIITPP